MKPISARKFNDMQDDNYLEYCEKCKNNGVKPEPQNRYFPKTVNYGYVVFDHLGSFVWKKRKSDF